MQRPVLDAKVPRYLLSRVCCRALLACTGIAGFGCETYQPKPADAIAISTNLTLKSTSALAQAARELRHPLLSPVPIAEDGSLTPQGAAVVAVLQNPSLRAARARRGVAVAQLLQAGILPNPQISANIDFPIAGSTDGAVTAFGMGATWDVSALVTREQEQLAATRDAEAVDLEIAWEEWQVAMSAKLHAARILWLGVQETELSREISQAEVAAQRADTNAKAGLVTIIERDAAAAVASKRRGALLSVLAAKLSESCLLRQSLGLSTDAKVMIIGEPESNVEPLPADAAVVEDLDRARLDLAALRAGYASQEAKLHAAVLSQFPKIGLGVTRARDTSNVGTLGFGITLDLPVFDRGQGRIAVERATREQLFEELTARTFEARSDAQRALVELRAVTPQIEESRRTVEQLNRLVSTLADARSRGEADITQLYQATNDAADATLDLLRLRQQQAELRIAFEIATGRLLGDHKP